MPSHHVCHPKRPKWMLRESERERETRLANFSLAARASQRQDSRKKAAQCHKGIALSLFAMIGRQKRNTMAVKEEFVLDCQVTPSRSLSQDDETFSLLNHSPSTSCCSPSMLLTRTQNCILISDFHLLPVPAAPTKLLLSHRHSLCPFIDAGERVDCGVIRRMFR